VTLEAFTPKDHWGRVALRARRTSQPFLTLLGLLLLVYALLGRSGSHIGIPLGGGTGIFIGDIVLLFGLATLLLWGGLERFFTLPIAWCWLIFFIWNAAQTFPYLSTYGLVALRDGAIWGYSLFAVVVASQLLARPAGFAILLNQYGRLARFYPYFALVMSPLQILFPDGILFLPEPNSLSGMQVHTVGNMGFVVSGVMTVPGMWWAALIIDNLIAGCWSRASLLSFIVVGVVLRLINPWGMRVSGRIVGIAGVIGLLLAITLMLDLDLGDIRAGRSLGPSQLLQNFVGSFSDTNNISLDGTREWREQWWDKIMDYTIHGPYFWTGKGYGINLAYDDGFGAFVEGNAWPLRSPHNSDLTFLARAGVPGFLLWVVLQSAWLIGILRVVLFARRTGRRKTVGLLALPITYWTAIMVLTATDPSIEGPAMGIWFWTIFGIGIAAAQMVRRDADFFERMEFRAGHVPIRRAAAPTRPSPSSGLI
jgi:hypothetical protein